MEWAEALQEVTEMEEEEGGDASKRAGTAMCTGMHVAQCKGETVASQGSN